ncbi:hypothetical protein SD960_09795 [Flavobacterium sp. MMLR14_040]|uniref:hypothetical protein n=1 Tax=Flavobacterium sp. MMLR14_040 TaxID=3093843 RepID=UPI00298F5CD1|nr:hypothetical protein [Flavobacterium sp. MMLR14_040]MDW8850382.1 hypothetical protein [Flavobacterium sp. MMLR14_040]
MDNLKKFNFTELDASEMKQVQGGGLAADIEAGIEETVNRIKVIRGNVHNFVDSVVNSVVEFVS